MLILRRIDDNINIVKTCTVCQQLKALSHFSTDVRLKDGHRAKCRDCHANYCRAIYQSRKARPPVSCGHIRCTKCLVDKPAADYYLDYRRSTGRQSLCRECHRYRMRKVHHLKLEDKLFSSARRRATKLNLPFDITVADVVIPDVCPVLGIPLQSSRNGCWADGSPSIDRIDPKKGYVRGNIAIISWRANDIKGNASLREIEMVCAWLRNATEPRFCDSDVCAVPKRSTKGTATLP